jgi:hypothetical protein
LKDYIFVKAGRCLYVPGYFEGGLYYVDDSDNNMGGIDKDTRVVAFHCLMYVFLFLLLSLVVVLCAHMDMVKWARAFSHKRNILI